MGLSEKRKIQELKATTIPEREKELADICGTAIPYEIDWPSFGDDADALNFLDNLACQRVTWAFRTICSDQLARDCIKEAVKTIRLKNVTDRKDMKLSFVDGVLELHLAFAQRTDGMYSDAEIKSVVERGL